MPRDVRLKRQRCKQECLTVFCESHCYRYARYIFSMQSKTRKSAPVHQWFIDRVFSLAEADEFPIVSNLASKYYWSLLCARAISHHFGPSLCAFGFIKSETDAILDNKGYGLRYPLGVLLAPGLQRSQRLQGAVLVSGGQVSTVQLLFHEFL